MTEKALVSVAEAARNIGVHRSTLIRQIARGQIRNWGGMVRVSEVIADRAANVRSPSLRVQRRPKQSAGSGLLHARILGDAPVHAPDERAAVLAGAWRAGMSPDVD
jgi:IS30 family transposase